MNNFLRCVPLICCVVLPLRAQTNEQAKAAAAGVVAAVNGKDPKLLEPLLSDRCTLPGLTPQEFSSQVAGVLTGWSWQVVAHRFKLKAGGRVLVTFVADNRGEWAFTMRLDEAGKIVELPLFTFTATVWLNPIAFAGPDSTVLPLVRYGDTWAVRAKVDDKEGLWQVDSGAGQLVVDASSFPASRYPGLGTSSSKSVTGATVAGDDCDVGTLEIGGQVATKVRANRQQLAHLTERDDKGEPVPFLGLIGARELAKFETRFDFDAATLTLVELNDAGEPVVPRPSSLTERYDFEMRLHLPLLQFTAGDTRLGLLFDTGAGGNVLHERHAADPALTLGNVTTTSLLGTSPDKATAKVADVHGLRIDGRVVPPMKTVLLAKMPVDGTDGIVGLPWVAGRPFALNYAQRCIVFGARRGASTPR